MSKGLAFTSFIFARQTNSKEMKNLFKIICFLFAFIPMVIYGQTAPDLQELIESAIATNGQLNEQKLRNQLTQLDDDRLKDLFLPRVDLTGEVGYIYASANFKMPGLDIPRADELGFEGIQIAERSNNLNISGISPSAKAEASMLIYSGGKVKYLKEANKEKGLAEQVLMEKTTDEIITEISKAYDQFSLLGESKLVLDAAKNRLNINRKTADKALGYGLITPYDHQKIELAQAVLDSKIVEYEGKKELLITQLHLLTGIDRERIALIQPILKPIDYLAVESELNHRAEIRALEHGINAAESKIKAEEKWWVPKVMAKTSLTYMGLYNNHVSTSKEVIYGTAYKLDLNPSRLNLFPIFQAGIGFQWDLFDGREGKTAIAEAQIQKEILENQKIDAEKMLKLNLANNQTQYEIANSQIELKSKAMKIAEKALINVEKEFRYGTKTSSDLIAAENDLVNAELEYQTAIFNQRRNAVELMKSTQDLRIDKL